MRVTGPSGHPSASERARRLASEVQRFGLHSAASVVERYTAIVDRTLSAALAAPLTGTPPAGRPDPLADSAGQVAQAYLQLLQTTASLVAASGLAGGREGHPRDDVVLLPAAAPGTSSHGTLWLHNETTTAVDAPTVTLSDLVAAPGHTVPRSCLAARCPAHVGPGLSHEVALHVHVPPGQPAGHYHGLALLSLDPTTPVRVTLLVLGQGEGS